MDEMLAPGDLVGGTFWLLSIAMIAAAIFLLLERKNVAARWHSAMTLTGVVMVVAAVHYYYLKQGWMAEAEAPIILRYVEWAVTLPIQVVLFFLLLAPLAPVSAPLFWRLLIGALIFVIGMFLGAAGYMSATLGFLIGMVGWLYVQGELYMGEAGRVNSATDSVPLHIAFNSLRLIVTVGWAIYPLGYFIQHLGGGVDENALNIVYNFADLLNKIIFGMIIYRLAVADSRKPAEDRSFATDYRD